MLAGRDRESEGCVENGLRLCRGAIRMREANVPSGASAPSLDRLRITWFSAGRGLKGCCCGSVISIWLILRCSASVQTITASRA